MQNSGFTGSGCGFSLGNTVGRKTLVNELWGAADPKAKPKAIKLFQNSYNFAVLGDYIVYGVFLSLWSCPGAGLERMACHSWGTNDLVTQERRVTPVCDIQPQLEYIIRPYQDAGAKVSVGKRLF